MNQKPVYGGMKKTMGVASVFAICTGAAFSSGFFLLPGMAADETGPSLPIVFGIAGLLMLPAIFSISELSSAMPRSGGPYFFITRSFGTLPGIIGAIGIYLQWLLKGAFAFVGVGYYLSLLIEVPVQHLALGLIIFFTFVNLTGVKQTSLIEIILVSVLMLVLGWFVLSGVLEIAPNPRQVAGRFQPLFPMGATGFLAALAMVFVSFGGMGQVASLAGEIRKPSRSIPRGMLLSLAVVTFFYLAGNAIIVALVEPNQLHDNQTPVAEAAQQLTRLSIPLVVIVIAALAAFTSTGNAVILSAARYPLALSRDRLLWKAFSKLSKKGIPTWSVIATGIILILLVVALDVEEIAKTASAFLLFTFVGLCLALVIFRESKTEEYKPGYKSPLYPWMQIAGIVIYFTLIFFSGFEVLLFMAGLIIMGTLWFYLGVRHHSSITAAIYPLFARMAGIPKEKDSRLILHDHLVAPLAARAIITTPDHENPPGQIIKKAASAISERIGGDTNELEKKLRTRIAEAEASNDLNLAIVTVLLHKIEQPEMVIIRGNVQEAGKTFDGMIILFDDQESSERLKAITSFIQKAFKHEHFARVWEHEEDSSALKEAISQTIATWPVKIEASAKSHVLSGKKVRDIELPDNSIIAILERNGLLQVPHGDTELEEEDKITFVADKHAMAILKKRFG
jgi:basic amino acid/polyamine antiporter, APA family